MFVSYFVNHVDIDRSYWVKSRETLVKLPDVATDMLE
jgi:hypothetical protein